VTTFHAIDYSYNNIQVDNVALGMQNKVVALPRGKVLGGSSMLNWMNYVRGNYRLILSFDG